VDILRLAPLTAEALPAVLDLDQRCFGGLWTWEGYQRELDSPVSDLIGLYGYPPQPQGTDGASGGASGSDTAITLLGMGCLWAILEEAHITILAVHPDHRGRGLGKLLLGALLFSAQRRGLEWATLEVRPSNRTALCLYQTMGFKQVGRRRGYYQDSGEDAVILWCKGLQTPEFQQRLQDWYGQSCDRLLQAGWKLETDALIGQPAAGR